MPAVNASSTTRSMCTRPARMTWSCAALNTSNASAVVLAGATQTTGRGLEDVLLAVLEQVELGAAVEQVVVVVAVAGTRVDEPLDELRRGGALLDDVGDGAGREAYQADRVEAADLLRVRRQQLLGDELEQHVVVALERREDVGVALERREPVLGEVAGAAAGLAGLLDGLGRVPGLRGLEPGGAALELALLLRVAARRCVCSRSMRATSWFCANR